MAKPDVDDPATFWTADPRRVSDESRRWRLQEGQAPGVPALLTLGRLDGNKAITVRKLMKGDMDPATVLGGPCSDRSFAPAGFIRCVLEAIDKLLGTQGVEELKTKRGTYLYCNTGENWALTIVRCTSRGSWLLTSRGLLVEKEVAR